MADEVQDDSALIASILAGIEKDRHADDASAEFKKIWGQAAEMVKQTYGLLPEDIAKGAHFMMPKFHDDGRTWEEWSRWYDEECAKVNGPLGDIMRNFPMPTADDNEVLSATGKKRKQK
jgi:hypothetical protein